jgi:hypothetical protein
MKDFALKALEQIETSAGKGIWDAHWGCAVIAGALLVEEDLIGEEAKPMVRDLLGEILKAKPGFEGKGDGVRACLPRDRFGARFLSELAPKAAVATEIGHDVIYPAYVMTALARFRIAPWESLADQLALLVQKVKASGPGWITVNGENQARALVEVDSPAVADAWEVFASFDRPKPMESGDMQLGHLLTHGHAIGMAKAWAGPELFRDLDLAFRKRLHGLRLATQDQRDKSPLPRRKLDPRAKEYWRLVASLGDMHGHAFKYAYSFLDLRKGHPSEDDLWAFGRIVWPDMELP